MLYADDTDIVSKSTECLSEDDDRHFDYFRINRFQRAPKENGDYSEHRKMKKKNMKWSGVTLVRVFRSLAT